jgi:trimeric autotransporter adhesin
MANVVIPYRFRVKRDTAANFTAANTLLLSGEFGLETDTRKLKIGDGVTAWNSLPYVSTTDVPEGSNLYHTAQRVRDTVLTGLSTATNAVIAATDTVLSALGKLQAQISGLIVQTITDGDTTHAPSGDAVFDALALKTTNSAAAITGGTINGASVGATTPASGAFTALSSTQNASIAGMPVGLGPGLDASNIAIGVGALSSRTTATVQVAIGSNALRDNQTQDANLAVGSGALALLTSGTANVAIGSGAGRDGTSHAASVLIGGNAGIFSNTVNAVAIGDNSLRYGGGTQPVAIGSGALANLSSGQGNVGIGFQALTAQTGGTGNVCVGFRAGYTATAANAITTGSHNTYVGHDSGPGTSTQLSYSSAFGAQALATTSNTVVLGRTADTTVIGATGTDGSDAKLQVTGAIKATTTIRPGSYTVATVPSASAAGAGAMIYVSNEAGGAVPAFSDGTNWRRVTDRAIIS